MTQQQMFFNWMLYGELIKFGVFANLWMSQITGVFPWMI